MRLDNPCITIMIKIPSDFLGKMVKQMKLEKKIVSAMAVCSAVLLVLTGCRNVPSSAPSGSTASSSQSSSPGSSSPAQSVSSSRETGSSGKASSAPAADEPLDAEAFSDMMDALEGYQPGTAGASLKLYTAACGVLNFSETYSENQADSLREALEETLSEMDAETRAQLADSFPDVDSAAQEILKKGVEAMSGILADAGNPNRYPSYDAEKYKDAVTLLTEMIDAAD